MELVVIPKIPAFNQAGYKDHTITGTGSVVMSTSNVWSTYLSNTYSSTSSGWDATGLRTCCCRYCFTLSYQLSSHSSGYFYTYLQHNGTTNISIFTETTYQIPICQNAIFDMAANEMQE